MADLVEHMKKGTFQEAYWIPEHGKRRDSSLFRRNKKFIKDTCGVPCWVCGTMKRREAHHVVEWSLWNAMDPRKATRLLQAIEFYDSDFTNRAKRPDLLRKALDKAEREHPIMDTPDDLRNCVVLCLKHHRKKLTGIHNISFPIWVALSCVPVRGGLLTREEVLMSVRRVKAIDEELAEMADRNYKPHRT